MEIPEETPRKASLCWICDNDLSKKPFRKYAELAHKSRSVKVCERCFDTEDGQGVRRRATREYFPRGQIDTPKLRAIKIKQDKKKMTDLHEKRMRLEIKVDKKQEARDIESLQIGLERLKSEIKTLSLNDDQRKEIKRLRKFNVDYLDKGTFKGATPSGMVRAFKTCYTNGFNRLLDEMRRPSPLAGDVGYRALHQALRYARDTKPPPLPPHPDFALQDSHPDKTDRDGGRWWSRTKPRYEADAKEKLSMDSQAVRARAAEKHRVESPPDQRHTGRQYVHEDSATKRPGGVPGRDRPSGG